MHAAATVGALGLALCACQPDDPLDRRCDFTPDGHGLPSTLIEFSRTGGLFTESFSLEVEAKIPGRLRYTLNGCPADESSAILDQPLQIDATMEVRVALFECGQSSPPRASHAYIEAASDLELHSNLPLIVLETWGQPGIDGLERPRPHRPAYMVVIEPDASGRAKIFDPPSFAGRVGMHIRGNSTAEEYPKKQYKIEAWTEFDEDRSVSMLGMPAEADWILHAPYSDKTFLRNHLVYRWSNRVGRWASRTRFVEAMIDRGDRLEEADYSGVYVWMEKIEVGPDRVNVARLASDVLSAPELSGGYLLARDWDFEERALVTATYDDTILIEYPKADDLAPAQRDWIVDYLDEFERALAGPRFDDPVEGYARYIEVDAFIDYHLLVELARNVDGFVLSTYMHKDREGRLVMGPLWDFNGSLGNADYFEAWNTEGWHYETPGFPEDNPHGYRWYERLFEDPGFRERYALRWQELRAGPLATDALMTDIDEGSALLEEAAVRNFRRWPILGEYVWPNDEGFEERRGYAEEVGYLREWVLARLAWMDQELR